MRNLWIETLSPRGLKAWLIASGLLVLLAGASVGFWVGAQFGGRSIVRGRFGVEDASMDGPTLPVASLHLTDERIFERLGLQPEQRVEVEACLAQFLGHVRHIQDEREAAGRQVESDLVSLLDEGQREQMLSIMREFRVDEVAEKVTQKVRRYRIELKLSNSQEETFYRVLLSNQLAKDDLSRGFCARKQAIGYDAARKEWADALQKLSAECSSKLEPLLSPEQWKRYREISERGRSLRDCEASPPAAPATAPSPASNRPAA